MSEIHTILGGKVRLYRRETGNNWYCSTFMNGKEQRKSTKEESLKLAKEFAEDWYLTLRGKHTRGELTFEKTFSKAGEQFLREFEADTAGETILEIEVRGKRGVEYCKSTTGAVRPFERMVERMVERNQPEPTGRLFPVDHKKQFNRILEEQVLRRIGNATAALCIRCVTATSRLGCSKALISIRSPRTAVQV